MVWLSRSKGTDYGRIEFWRPFAQVLRTELGLVVCVHYFSQGTLHASLDQTGNQWHLRQKQDSRL
jgi:hypothetical protein